jgi:DNA invertase Pin-like site-specific DNA recombinase
MTTGEVQRVIGYVRVSTDEQADSGAGLAAQRSAIEAECERRGWELVEVAEDAGYSGKDLKRPAIRVALDRLDAGEADGLVVAKLDRLSRSVLDFAAFMERAQRKGWAVVVLDLGVDTATPQGELVANTFAAFAQFERRLIGQRTREALAALPPERRAKVGRPRQLDAKVARRIRNLRSRGHSLAKIAERLNADDVPTAHGGAKWYPSTVRAVLERRGEPTTGRKAGASSGDGSPARGRRDS